MRAHSASKRGHVLVLIGRALRSDRLRSRDPPAPWRDGAEPAGAGRCGQILRGAREQRLIAPLELGPDPTGRGVAAQERRPALDLGGERVFRGACRWPCRLACPETWGEHGERQQRGGGHKGGDSRDRHGAATMPRSRRFFNPACPRTTLRHRLEEFPDLVRSVDVPVGMAKQALAVHGGMRAVVAAALDGVERDTALVGRGP